MRRWVGWLGLVAAATAVTVVAACRQVAGITSNAPEDLTSSVCGLPYGTSECASCVHTNCCAESSACGADLGCAAYEGCLGTCQGDPTCRAQCLIDHHSDYTAASSIPALGACLASRCDAPCGLACGAVGSVLASSPDAAPDCQSCVQAHGCQAGRACASSAECIDVDQCERGCLTLDCMEACVSQRDAGATLALATRQVFVGNCASQCGLGSDWSCVGNVSWPVAQSKTVAVTVAVENGSGQPVPGAELSVSEYCPPSDEGGTPVLMAGQTDGTGTATLTVPQSTTAGPGFNHGLDGCIAATAPGYLPTFWYWGFPLTEPAVVFTATEPGGGKHWIPLISASDFAALNTAASVTQDPSRGIVGVTLPDCIGGSAPGVKVTTDPDDPAVRVLYGTSFSAAETVSDPTGLAFLVNVSPGPLTLIATPTAIGKPSSHITVNVAASTFTEVLMYPTP
jgi:hypothetical protein